MSHNVFDTCVRYNDGSKMHFDVLVPAPQDKDEAKKSALHWLQSIGINTSDIASIENHFCHNAISSLEIADVINQQGYAIIKSRGCPDYYC